MNYSVGCSPVFLVTSRIRPREIAKRVLTNSYGYDSIYSILYLLSFENISKFEVRNSSHEGQI